ncbi:winged helix-turn-helix domain-containing protein [Microbispora sp. RL4-1S]|uniref:Winged helix-turn-helix domain-containing protein n=1 Tax=Microbispora oryzae TaxID=2806554 RepID=A0A940WLY0_9ACTN|nr:AfsR/SARP family transcriptional regulator [Microbispora oryzae]MBP2707911.1 winged helix-turn-helix domain-containing protein [Microbispora oryzae]
MDGAMVGGTAGVMVSGTAGPGRRPVFEFRVLGPLTVLKDGVELPMRANRELVILASLLLNANRVMSVERLIEAVWSDAAPRSAWRQIAICVSRLRRTLGAGVIETSSPGYLLRAASDSVDWGRFTTLVARSRGEAAGGDRDRAVLLLREALALWQGEPFEDIRGLGYDAARMAEVRLDALETCLDLEIELGRHHQVIPELLALVAESPLRERPRAQLMLAQYRAGRRAEALRTYQETRRHLLEQIGLEPGPALRRLHEQILRDESVLMRASAPRPRAGQMVPCQLPPQVLPFVGRADELTALDAALRPDPETARPGTMILSGPAGVGTTTLALRWGHARIDWFPDGQLFADMAEDGSATVLDRFLRALGVPGPDIPDDHAEKVSLYRSCTARRRLLVVLDDVRDAAQARPLLPGGPACRVIVTSARPLDDLVARQGAHRVFVPPLGDDVARELAGMLVGPAGTALGPQAVTELVSDLVTTSCGSPLSLRLGAARLQSRSAALVPGAARPRS